MLTKSASIYMVEVQFDLPGRGGRICSTEAKMVATALRTAVHSFRPEEEIALLLGKSEA
jgi:hypothetical protein